MIVIFDTNIWLSHLGMRSPAASAIRYFLKQNGYQVALPEVIRLEVVANLNIKLTGLVEEIRNSHQQLLTAFGELHGIKLPTPTEVQELIPVLFSSLGVNLIEIPFSLESAHSSLLKTIEKVPPSHNNQQFKDGVIWADCLSLLKRDQVTFVTSDSAFYSGNKYESGLAKNLQWEAEKYSNEIHIVSSLAGLLETLPKTVSFDDERLVAVALAEAPSDVDAIRSNGFTLGRPPRITRSVFATEEADKLFFECSIEIPCPDTTSSHRQDGVLIINADGRYSSDSGEFDNFRMQTFGFSFQDESGEVIERKSVWARGSVMGSKVVTSAIRHRLDE